MGEEPFIMLSLKGDKTKKLANALTNKSADKILAYLASKEHATESEIAKALGLPVSTVNYTMKILVDAKLVVADEYHYSTKGREIKHYSLAKKYIIIAPDEQDNFLQRIQKYLPAFAITVGVAGLVRAFQAFQTTNTPSVAFDTQAMMRAEVMTQPLAPLDWFPFFLLGAFILFILTLLIEYWRKN